ncbi:dihydrodipicolinate synthase family protein [Desertihabitans brevis]|uniref:Dihydrodipicolinate synthase family protein n=1 Tax=Desertihabitans brevis TaxID=2268447 RepID=A0A367Z020_9ACTN|nr:dihydrodipicolinate synthase family protein [Desertihabitans brevis]RCK71237.1 dihydrodipicolinate synthase family protein [Desertihabitans brevis]
MSQEPVRGVVVPVITPLDPDGEVDEASMASQVERLVDAGVHGVFVLGTTGEFPFLTDAQRALAVRAALGAAAGRIPVLVGVADTATPRVLDHVAAVADLPIAGVVVTAPFYAATSSPEIRQHFRLIHREVPRLAVYAYENPPRVNGASLSTADVMALAEEGAIVGLKDSSGSDARLRQHVLERRRRSLDDFVILTGSELTVDCALLIGVDGVVPGLGNVDPAGFVRLYDAARAGDLLAARAEQERLFELFDIVTIGTEQPMGGSSRALGAFKAAVQALGGIAHRCTAAPAVQLGDADVASVVAVLRRAGLEPSPHAAPTAVTDPAGLLAAR